MLQRPIFPLLILFLATTHLFGQYRSEPDALSMRVFAPNFLFPQDQEWRPGDFGRGLEAAYSRHLGSVFNLSVPVKLGTATYLLNEAGDTREAGYLGLDALLEVKFSQPGQFLNPALFFGGGMFLDQDEHAQWNIPAGLSIDFLLGPGFYLSTKGEYRLGFDDLTENIQVGIGFKVLMGKGAPEPEPVLPPSAPDRDGDTVPDSQDQCPDTPGLVGMRGCPDADRDGVPDQEDQCPLFAGPVELNGCPDSDGDGVPDRDDDCPQVAGPATNKGCPVSVDSDADGIPDDLDACPNVPGPAQTNGCPDGDGDGVIDSQDRCPNTPGSAASQGCPEIADADREILDLAMRTVKFETGNAQLRATSFPILDQIVELMRRYSDYYLRISGHTDSIGSADSNQRLSEQRAKTCYDYLVSRGIDPARISYRGFGESEPIGDNRFEDGRELNRRVEFELYLRDN